MAIFTPGPLVGQISGRVGGIVASRNRGGAYWRNGSIPSASTTPRALQVKAMLGMAAQLWANVTADNRQAWLKYAQTHPATNRLGRAIQLTANNWFVRCNSILLGCDEDAILLPPTHPTPAAVPIVGLAVLVQTDPLDPASSVTVTLPAAVEAHQLVEVFGCVVSTPTINYVRNLFTRIDFTAAAAGPALTLTAETVAALGTLQVGNVYHFAVRIVDTRTGLTSTRVSARVTAIATT